MNCDIFCHDTNNYWYFDNRNKKFNVQKYLSLWLLIINKSKPFQNYSSDRDSWKGKKFHLCFVLWSRIFQVGGTKACTFPIPLHPWTKHMVCPFIPALLYLLVVCELMMYRIMYCMVALVSRYISYREKLHCCSSNYCNMLTTRWLCLLFLEITLIHVSDKSQPVDLLNWFQCVVIPTEMEPRMCPCVKKNARKRRLHEHVDWEEKFQELSQHIGNGKWKQLGRVLGVGDSRIQEIEHDCSMRQDGLQEKTYQVLKAWRDLHPDRCSLNNLFSALCKVGLGYMARQYCLAVEMGWYQHGEGCIHVNLF